MLPADWLPAIIEVAAISLGLFFYLLHWSVRGRLRRIRCAKMLLAELNILSRIVRPYNDTLDGNAIENSTRILPHNTYDGLVSSASISYLNQPLQERIHSFYDLIITHNHDLNPRRGIQSGGFGPATPIKPELRKVTKAVKAFLRENEYDRRWILKLFRAYDDDD